MATAAAKKKVTIFGPESNGITMTPRDFDRADFVEGWRYELVNGVLVVSSTPLRNERDPNQELGYLLRVYQDTHPRGAILDVTLPEEIVVTGDNRRRADRVIWTGLGRLPTQDDVPSIIAESVSAGRRKWLRDYETKRDEYMAIGIKQYWIINRFDHTLTVYSFQGGRARKRVYHRNQTYKTELLPGFELPLGRLFAMADRWEGEEASPDS
jgi:Uma2 family endonuclease